MIDSSLASHHGRRSSCFDDNGIAKKPKDKDFRYVGGKKCWKRWLRKSGGDRDGDGRKEAWKLIQTRKSFVGWLKGNSESRPGAGAGAYHSFRKPRWHCPAQ
jgi:hypothetical protein